MSGKHDPIFTCCVCGAKIPPVTREELRNKGCSTRMPDGSELHHCPHHSNEEIKQMARAVPGFSTGNTYRKGIL